MVNITIYVEGGVLPNDSLDVQTIDNSEKLRESFHNLLSQIIDNKLFNLVIEMGASYTNAAKFFKAAIEKHSNQLLIIDLDAPKSQKVEKLKELDLQKYNEFVFFMVQEMEAWILSQPEIIDRYLSEKYHRERCSEKLYEHNLLINRHPEDINNPSDVLQIIMKRYFTVVKRGQKKKKGYGKLKDAPDLLKKLDGETLKQTFSDLSNLYNKLNNK